MPGTVLAVANGDANTGGGGGGCGSGGSGVVIIKYSNSQVVDGSGVVVAVVDDGKVRDTHQEFYRASGGPTRVVNHASNDKGLSDHATHVAGIIGAYGKSTVENAKGIASDCSMVAFDLNDFYRPSPQGSDTWYTSNALYLTQDEYEMSNHSYGPAFGYSFANVQLQSGTVGLHNILHWTRYKQLYDAARPYEFDMFGKYSELTRNIDQFCYRTPYNLQVWAVGNDGSRTVNDTTNRAFTLADGTVFASDTYITVDLNATQTLQTATAANIKRYKPNAGTNYHEVYDGATYRIPKSTGTYIYDNIGGSVMKNCLTVGAISTDTGSPYAADPLRDANRAVFSSKGPTDDGRIKPDLVAWGVDISSCIATSNTSYASYQGTSMAAPIVCGVSALALQYYRMRCGNHAARVRSETMRALLVGTSYTNGQPPNYVTGHGLVDASACLGFIRDWDFDNTDNPKFRSLVEANYNWGTQTHELTPKGTSDTVRICMCWNDYTAYDTPLPAPGVDVATSVVVNKLKTHVEDAVGNRYYPWYLNRSRPADAARRSVGVGEYDAVLDERTPYDTIQMIEFTPANTGAHKLVVTSDSATMPSTYVGQPYTVLFSNVRKKKMPDASFSNLRDNKLTLTIDPPLPDMRLFKSVAVKWNGNAAPFWRSVSMAGGGPAPSVTSTAAITVPWEDISQQGGAWPASSVGSSTVPALDVSMVLYQSLAEAAQTGKTFDLSWVVPFHDVSYYQSPNALTKVYYTKNGAGTREVDASINVISANDVYLKFTWPSGASPTFRSNANRSTSDKSNYIKDVSMTWGNGGAWHDITSHCELSFNVPEEGKGSDIDAIKINFNPASIYSTPLTASTAGTGGTSGARFAVGLYKDLSTKTGVTGIESPQITVDHIAILSYYPPSALTGVSTTHYGVTYTTSSSTNYGNPFENWKAYDKTSGNNGWATTSQYHGTSTLHTGTDALGSFSGQWNKLHMSTAAVVTSVNVVGRSGNDHQAPDSWRILGSNDDTNWTQLHHSTNAMEYNSGNGYTETLVPANLTAYEYYAIIVDSVQGPGTPYCTISEITYNR